MSTEDELFETLKYRRRGERYDYWVNDNGEFHRVGAPAVVWDDGRCSWYQNGRLHREDGPAVVAATGSLYWWKNGLLHREGGPAVEYHNGGTEWWVNGVRST